MTDEHIPTLAEKMAAQEKEFDVKVDPEQIKKELPEMWDELKQFTEEMDGYEEKTKNATSIVGVPMIHPTVNMVFQFLIAGGYVRNDKADIEHVTTQALEELTRARTQAEAKLRDTFFKKTYMEAVNLKANIEQAHRVVKDLGSTPEEKLSDKEKANLEEAEYIIMHDGEIKPGEDVEAGVEKIANAEMIDVVVTQEMIDANPEEFKDINVGETIQVPKLEEEGAEEQKATISKKETVEEPNQPANDEQQPQ